MFPYKRLWQKLNYENHISALREFDIGGPNALNAVFFDPNNAPINMNLLWEYINQFKNCLSFYIEIRLEGIGETTNIETEVINSYSRSVDKPYNTEFLFKIGEFFSFVLSAYFINM